ncbi:MAG: hypothetical protein DRP97_05215 [Candidatus Latescibacterota bacterium]|nr:MAG: hypothetical protein DRP97_05215 [Candidatus Latescibacterota bacterium]
MAAFQMTITTHPNSDHADGPDSVGVMVDRLAGAGFDILLPHVKIGGEAFYHSHIAKVHPQFAEWDPLTVIVQKAKAAGLQVYAQVCVFPEGENSALIQSDASLRAMTIEGEPTPWACPASEKVRQYELSIFEEIMDNYDVNGVYMDYIRYNLDNVCFCPRCRSRFKEETGTDPVEIGRFSGFDESAQRGRNRKHPAWVQWIEWRVAQITTFVEALSAAARKRECALSGAVFMDYPECIVNQGQDWAEWTEKGLLDSVVPMTYTNSLLMLKKRTKTHLAHVKGNCALWEGLGQNSSRSNLSTEALIEQIEAVRDEGAQGVMIFPYSTLTDEDLAALGKLNV